MASNPYNRKMRLSDNRIVFCIKLWLKELKEADRPNDEWIESGIIMHIENEIINGEYCSDQEYHDSKVVM